MYSQGVNQSTSGTDKVNSIINCHLLTGRIGKPGMGPFLVTGQPNAMGGREVGGLANMLAARLELDDALHRELVQIFWGAPAIASRPGLKAVELFEAIEEGRIKAVWIMGTSLVVSPHDCDQDDARREGGQPFLAGTQSNVISDAACDNSALICTGDIEVEFMMTLLPGADLVGYAYWLVA